MSDLVLKENDKLVNFIHGLENEFIEVLVNDNVAFKQEAYFAVQILEKNDYALRIARNAPKSLKNAIINVATIGLSLNPTMGLAYLVPRKNEICLDISYLGLIKLAQDVGGVIDVKAEIVHEKDTFEITGAFKEPNHAFSPFSDRGGVVGAYVVARTPSDHYLTTVMPISEIKLIRDSSESYKNANTRKYSPWVKHEGEMIKKGLALDTEIPTISGWKKMEDMEVGDVVFDKDGKPVTVKDVSEIKHITCYKITFANNESIICDNEHRWVARYGGSHLYKKPFTVITVNEMYKAKEDGLAVTIPIQGNLDTPVATLPIDPYLLGYWLGDGTARRSQVTCCKEDLENLKAAILKAGFQVGKVTRDKRGSNSYCVGIIKGLLVSLREAGLLNNKHVPPKYLRASIEQRKQLLAGLLDSDGHICKARGRVHFSNKNKSLTLAVYELAASLSDSPTYKVREMKGFGVTTIAHIVHWKPSFCPCVNPRKAKNYVPRKILPYRAIKKIEIIPTVPTRCISVTGDSETFLAGRNMVPTHNTVIRRAYKSWSKSEKVTLLDKAIAISDEAQAIEFKSEYQQDIDDMDRDFPIPPEEKEIGSPEYRVQNAKFRGKQLKDVDNDDLFAYVETLDKRHEKNEAKGWELTLKESINMYLSVFDNDDI